MAQGQKHEPTDETRAKVRSLVAVGVPQDDVAKILEVSAPTLRKHYREQLDVAKAEANAQVAGALFRIATTPGRQQVTAAIFWLKCQAGWRDRDPVQTHVHASADSATAQTLLASLKEAKDYVPDDEDRAFLESLDARAGDLDPERN